MEAGERANAGTEPRPAPPGRKAPRPPLPTSPTAHSAHRALSPVLVGTGESRRPAWPAAPFLPRQRARLAFSVKFFCPHFDL